MLYPYLLSVILALTSFAVSFGITATCHLCIALVT
jgi:hypothetical protein